MSAKRWRAGPALLLLPLAVSIAPWISTLAFLRVGAGEVEGAMFVTASVGAISFLLTGPLAGLVLAILARERPLDVRKFAGLFFLVSAPALAFQIFGFGMTVVPAILYAGGSDAPDAPASLLFAAAVGVVWYSVFVLLFYRASRAGIAKMAVASSFVVVTFAFLATRLIR